MPLATGLLIKDRYHIVSLLAQGGMGAVYRAWDLNLKMPVAVKENLDPSSEGQMQFEREALILARISHSNLPRVIDHFSLPGHGQFLVMDFVEGEDLEEIFQKSGGSNKPANQGTSSPASQNHPHLSEAQVIPWILQVCDALEYLHAQSPPIVHRDIKPANIKIRPDGRAMLVDFGIAKTYDPKFSTLAGAKAVTAGYSPPEQYGGGKTDPRSDIYALGATLYHLLTGEKPPESVQRMAGGTKTPSPRQLNPQISMAIEIALLKAMAVPIERRFQSVRELRDALVPPKRPLPATSYGQPFVPSPTSATPLSSRATSSSMLPSSHHYSTYWPIYLLGGIGVIIILLIVGRLTVPGLSSISEPSNNEILAVVDSPNPAPTIAMITSSETPTTIATFPLIDTITPSPPGLQNLGQIPTMPIWPVFLQDPFDLNRNKWPTEQNQGSQCMIELGKYRCMTTPGTAAHQWLVLENVLLEENFFLSVDIEVVEGPKNSQAGLIYRDNPNGRYLFSVRSDGFFRISSIQKRLANWIYLVDWTSSKFIHIGEPNRLSVSGKGTTYIFFVNGDLVAEIEDDQWQNGSPGIHFFSAAIDTNVIFEFDNFELRQP